MLTISGWLKNWRVSILFAASVALLLASANRLDAQVGKAIG